MRTRLYLAGPMTGYPDMNFPAFRSAKAWLETEGFQVLSPVDLDINVQAVDNGGEDRHLYLRHDFRLVAAADAIGMLPGWEQSIGATCELAVAKMLRLDEYVVARPASRGRLAPYVATRTALPLHLEVLAEGLGVTFA